jgi:hypothetical protein
MHTNTFETFWSEQKLAYDLPDKSLRRLEPEYSLMDEVVCPQDDSDISPSLSAVENLPNNDNSSGKEEANAPAKKPARAGKKKTTDNNNKETKPRQPLSNKKNAQPIATKAPRKRATTKAQTAAKAPKTAPTTANPKKTTTRKPTAKTAKPTGVVKNVSPKKDAHAPTSLAISVPPRGPLSAREAYEQCMARHQNEPKLRGPSSGEDDDSESESGSEEE